MAMDCENMQWSSKKYQIVGKFFPEGRSLSFEISKFKTNTADMFTLRLIRLQVKHKMGRCMDLVESSLICPKISFVGVPAWQVPLSVRVPRPAAGGGEDERIKGWKDKRIKGCCCCSLQVWRCPSLSIHLCCSVPPLNGVTQLKVEQETESK